MMQTNQYYDGTQTIHHITASQQISITLLQYIQQLFNDITIYNNPQMYDLVTNSQKGYVRILDLINTRTFKNFVYRNNNLFVNSQQISRVIREDSKKLIVKNQKIKRLQPFVDKINTKQLIPIFIDRLPRKQTIQIYQFFKSIVGNIYRIYHKKNQRWAIIIIDDYQPLRLVKQQLYLGNQKISVLNPQETLTSYGENQRLSCDFSIVKLYENKKMIQIHHDLLGLDKQLRHVKEYQDQGQMCSNAKNRYRDMANDRYGEREGYEGNQSEQDYQDNQQYQGMRYKQQNMFQNIQQLSHINKQKQYIKWQQRLSGQNKGNNNKMKQKQKVFKHFLNQNDEAIHLKQRIMKQRTMRKQINSILTYDNSCLLLLRDGNRQNRNKQMN